MRKLFTKLFLGFYLTFSGVVFSDVPEKYIGKWSFQVKTKPGFPWWQQIKYPVKLTIMKNGVLFEDQMGFKCSPKTFLYDDELDNIVFKNCLPSKSALSFSPFYKMMIVDDKLVGEVWTYKLLFKLDGNRMNPCKTQKTNVSTKKH